MKNVAIVVLFLATVAFASLYLQQSRKTIEAQTAADGLQQKIAALQTGLEEEEKRTAILRQEVTQVRNDAAVREQALVKAGASSPQNGKSPSRPGLANSDSSKSANPFSSFAKIFNNPEMKDALATQQKAAMGPMIDKNYAKLFSDLGLTPEQTSALKELLLKKQMSGAEAGMSMLSENFDPAASTNMVQQIKAATDAADAEIKGFLGNEKFGQLQSYEKSMADRMVVSGLKDQLGTGAIGLTAEQEQQLIGAMTQERENFKFTTDLSNKNNLAGDLSSIFNEERLGGYLQEMDQLNERFLGRAQGILTPDQLDSFQKYLNSQQAIQKAGMQMMKAFAPGKSSANP